MAGGQSRHARRAAKRARGARPKHRCEKWRQLRRRRQLGGCDREAAVHGPLLMAVTRATGRTDDDASQEARALGCEAPLREVATVAAASARRLRSGSGGPRAAADGWRPEPPCTTGSEASQRSPITKHRCEKWRRLRQRRQLGGCDQDSAVHGPLLMAGSQSRHARRAAKRARGARLRSTAARSGGSCGGGGSSEAAIGKRRSTGRC